MSKIKKLTAGVELHSRISAKGNPYKVIVLELSLPGGGTYNLELFVNNEQQTLLSLAQ